MILKKTRSYILMHLLLLREDFILHVLIFVFIFLFYHNHNSHVSNVHFLFSDSNRARSIYILHQPSISFQNRTDDDINARFSLAPTNNFHNLAYFLPDRKLSGFKPTWPRVRNTEIYTTLALYDVRN